MAEENLDFNIEQLPFSLEAEQSVLGAILIEPECISRVLELLVPESFYRPQHQQLFSIMLGMFTSAQPIDFITVLEKAKAERIFASDGDAKGYLTQLVQVVPSAANVEAYAKLVQEKYYMRTLINVAKSIITNSEKSDADARGLMEFAEQKLYEIRQGKDATGLVKVDRAIFELYDKLQRISGDDKKQYVGIPTGFSALDSLTTGLNRTDLILLAARPAMGKTAFVLSMAKNIAVNYRNPVAVFSLEMSNVQLVNRLISNACEIPSEKIKSGQLADYEWQQLDYKLRDLLDAPLYVDDTPSLSVFELRTKARRLVREHGVRIIIIDYLQLMNASGMSFGSRQEEVSTISRSLKGLAKELNIPIIALSQLNRGVESREGEEGKRPQLSDLRESGAIEQDADMVCFIHRPEYYKIYTSQDGTDLRGMAEIIIAKHRNGAVGDVRLRFIGQYTRFQNPEDDMVIPHPAEGGGATYGSKINAVGDGSIPPPAEFAPQTDNPFGGVGSDGPLPF